MNFSGIPARSLIGRSLRLPLRLIPRDACIPILQGRLRGMRWIAGSSIHGCWLGSYEYAKRRLFERTIPAGSVVFDIGAHVGFYTLLASVLVGPTGSVFAFEPVPSNVHYLRKHLCLNSVQNVTVIEAAVSDADGFCAFQEGAISLTGHLSATGGLHVQAVRLDRLVSEGAIPSPQYIKIDVEGAEARVLRGATELLARDHPVVFLSTHGREVNADCRGFLGSLGYTVEPIGAESVQEASEILSYV